MNIKIKCSGPDEIMKVTPGCSHKSVTVIFIFDNSQKCSSCRGVNTDGVDSAVALGPVGWWGPTERAFKMTFSQIQS